MAYTVGSLVQTRGREGGVPRDSTEDMPVLRSYGGRLVSNIDVRYDSLTILAVCYQDSNKRQSG